jgi:hypothetical protein
MVVSTEMTKLFFDFMETPLPKCLEDDFNALNLPQDCGLDMEWVGPRQGLPAEQHKLFLFDIWQYAGEWLGTADFWKRYGLLSQMMLQIETSKVKLAPCFDNPGLVEYFAGQMQQGELVEGIVLRRFDSKLIGSTKRCEGNPQMLKVKFQHVKGGDK